MKSNACSTKEVEPTAHLMSDEAKAFVAIGRNFPAHETVQHGRDEYARGPVHANSVEGFNLRVQRTVAGVFHHISPEHADLYFHEIGFRWSQRIVEGQVVRRNRHGREKTRTLWSRQRSVSGGLFRHPFCARKPWRIGELWGKPSR
jgi:hypothetical protein